MCCPYLLEVWILTFCTFKFIISLKYKKESTITDYTYNVYPVGQDFGMVEVTLHYAKVKNIYI